MAIITELKRRVLEKETRHTETECTYSIIQESDGAKLLQLDTYGSESRQIPGKVSQTIRFSPQGLKQLKQILKDNFQD